jgi:glyoxylate/hydroxypyruvate reductase A
LSILFQSADADAAQALALLAEYLPQARISRWPQGADQAHDIAVCWQPPPGFFAGRRFKAIFNMGAGVDALLRDPELPAGVPLIRLEDAGMAAQMEEYVAWAALTGLRNFQAYARQQAKAQWRQLEPQPRDRYPVGIMGLGLLGTRVAHYLRAMGFPVHGWNRSARAIEGVHCYAGAEELPDFLAATRMLVCMLPLTEVTRGMLDGALLSQLPRGAHLVNVGRGQHLAEADLLALLASGHLAGAILDVLSEEPLPPGHAFWHHPEIIITPHIAAQTLTREAMRQIAGKILALERGEPVSGVVNRTQGY